MIDNQSTDDLVRIALAGGGTYPELRKANYR